jgi:hypothetical protein
VSFPDGTSNTITMAEHYAICGSAQYKYLFSLNMGLSFRRATFADGGTIPHHAMLMDVYPVTSGNPPRTVGSEAGPLFQIRPTRETCNPRIPQTPHSALTVALADGSVRTLSARIDPAAYWAAITPAAGEVASLD